MKLGMEVGLGSGHTVLGGTQSASTKGAQPPIFGPCPLWPNGLDGIKTPFGTEVDLGPGHIVLDGDPAPPRPPSFRPICLLWPRSPISATAELL